MTAARRWRAGALGLAVVVAAAAVRAVAPGPVADALFVPAVDALYAAAPLPHRPEIAIVDIDRATLAEAGSWPWPRERLAALIDAVAAARPKVLALDILVAEPDRRSPAALARSLAEATGRDDLARLAADLPDPDRRLAEAIGAVPTVIGFLASPEATDPPPGPPVVAQRDAGLRGLWTEPGAEGPLPALAEAAAGVGVLSLIGDAGDGVIRAVPGLAAVAGRAYAGLAGEAVRVAGGARSHLVAGDPPVLAVAGHAVPLDPAGAMALRLADPAGRAAATVPARLLLAGPPSPETAAALAGKIVFLGSSAPELGGLRPTAADPLTPSVHVQADAAGQILAGRVPVRPVWAAVAEVAGGLGLAAVMIAAGALAGPALGTLVAAGLALLWAGAAAAATLHADRIVDPVTPPALALAGFAVASLAAFAETRRREALIRRRFEQHLAPDVVSRIVERPDLVRLEGELRPVTALFTDVEGFTSLTERAEPRALVAVLDRYFEGVVQAIAAEGGMVDKIVGDAVHALFNVPLDQPDHAPRALAAAEAVAAFAARFRTTPEAAALGFGRTRIGLETGPAIVGDVGGGRKLDFTAHGTAVNSAARLEAANKQFGSTVACGPALAAAVPGRRFRPLGRITLRGLSAPSLVAEPWPLETPDAVIEAYAAAFALVETDPEAAARAFAALAAGRPDDAVLATWAERLGPSAGEGGGSFPAAVETAPSAPPNP